MKNLKTIFDHVFVCVLGSGRVPVLVVIVTELGGVEQGNPPKVPVIVRT